MGIGGPPHPPPPPPAQNAETVWPGCALRKLLPTLGLRALAAQFLERNVDIGVRVQCAPDHRPVKGIIFNLLQETVTREFGDDTWDKLLEAAGTEGVYTTLGNYPDEELIRLVGAASAELKLPPDQIVRWFGTQALPLLAGKYPAFFARHQSTRSFLLTLNGIIHPEVRKLYPGAATPDFDFDTTSPDVLVMLYRSKRKLCALAEGLIEGAAGQFGETVAMHHPQCMHRGDPHCRLELSFAKKQAVP